MPEDLRDKRMIIKKELTNLGRTLTSPGAVKFVRLFVRVLYFLHRQAFSLSIL